MESLSEADRIALINDIATRAGTIADLTKWYGLTKAELKTFLDQNKEAIEEARDTHEGKEEQLTNPEPDPKQLDDLWITNKFERLKRYQEMADVLYADAINGSLGGADLATTVREFRSYAQLAANELGQLLHRGSGDAGTGDSLSIDFVGVDPETLR